MARTFVVGVDEAGLGPNLGPLVIGASVWSCDRGIDLNGLQDKLLPHFQPRKIGRIGSDAFIPLGDSKLLYQSGMPTDSLAIGVVTLLRWALNLKDNLVKNSFAVVQQSSSQRQGKLKSESHNLITHCNEVMQITGASESLSSEAVLLLPWYQAGDDEKIAESITDMAWDSIASNGLSQAGMGFHGMRARLVDEIQFNQQLVKQGGKGKLLSVLSLELVREVVERLPIETGDEVEIYCDRHGGRQRYHELLSEIFPGYFFWIDRESPEESVYSTKQTEVSMRIRFTVGGDRHPPTAVASMLAKWLREICMERFNAYWQVYVPSLKRTAGYPVDAKRFAEELASSGVEGLLSRDLWWRKA